MWIGHDRVLKISENQSSTFTQLDKIAGFARIAQQTVVYNVLA